MLCTQSRSQTDKKCLIQQDKSYTGVFEAVYRSRVNRKRRYHRADNEELLAKAPAVCYEIRAVVVASYWKTALPSSSKLTYVHADRHAVHINVTLNVNEYTYFCVGPNLCVYNVPHCAISVHPYSVAYW